MKKPAKKPKKLPEVPAVQMQRNLIKSEALLLRLTPADKETIQKVATQLQISATELLTKSALMVARKLGKKK